MKGRLAFIALCLLIGAILNVIVAWRFALISLPIDRDQSLDPEITAELWDRYVPEPRTDRTIKSMLQAGLGVTDIILEAPYKDSSRDRFRACWVVRAGYPLVALEGESHRNANPTFGTPGQVAVSAYFKYTRGLWELPAGSTVLSPPIYRRAVPLRPVWPGFILNTILYAGLVWLLLVGQHRIRRRARLDRGRCPGCKYDLRGAITNEAITCPECGCVIASRDLTRPRQIPRLWMVWSLVPALALAIVWFIGLSNWEDLSFQLIYAERTIRPVPIAMLIILGSWLFMYSLRAYADRPARTRKLISGCVTAILVPIFAFSLYALIVRFLP